MLAIVFMYFLTSDYEISKRKYSFKTVCCSRILFTLGSNESYLVTVVLKNVGCLIEINFEVLEVKELQQKYPAIFIIMSSIELFKLLVRF